MSTGKPQPLGPSNFMEALDTGTWEKDGVPLTVAKEEGERAKDEERGMAAASFTSCSSTEESEETDEDSEPEPPPAVRRKVSFADAFGLDLVSVKEFDIADLTETEHSNRKTEIKDYYEEYYLSCLFNVPSTPEELSQRLQDQKLELESIELLPRSTVLRGIVRVLNLCFDKSVYARISLDGWKSHFDLLAEYIPGSSDGETDSFAFKLTLVPSFDQDGVKVEFCLRYETSVGMFWANNKDTNYVMFCRQKVKEVIRDQEKEQKDSINHKAKLSCLKARRKNNSDEWAIGITTPTINIDTTALHGADGTEQETVNSTTLHANVHHDKDQELLVASVKSRRRAARLARVQDYLSQRRQDVIQTNSANWLPKTRPQNHNLLHHRPFNHPSDPEIRIPALGDSTSVTLSPIQHIELVNDKPQILTYHQIPLLSLDWSKEKNETMGAADVDNIVMEVANGISSKTSTDNDKDKTSVCDLWEAFLNGTESTDSSNVPEADWLQTATLVGPSNNKDEPGLTPTVENQHILLADPNTHLCTSSLADESWSHTHVTPLASDPQSTWPKEDTSSPRDSNLVAHVTIERSAGHSVTETVKESSPSRTDTVSEGAVDSLAQWQKHVERGGEGGENIEATEEPFKPHAAELVTSSGEQELADQNALLGDPNASTGDRFSWEGGQREGNSYHGEEKVICSAYKGEVDLLACREIISQGINENIPAYLKSFSEEGQAKLDNVNESVFRTNQTEDKNLKTMDQSQSEHKLFCLKQNEELFLNHKEREHTLDEFGLIQSHIEFGAGQTNEEEPTQKDTFKKEITQLEAEESVIDTILNANCIEAEEFSKERFRQERAQHVFSENEEEKQEECRQDTYAVTHYLSKKNVFRKLEVTGNSVVWDEGKEKVSTEKEAVEELREENKNNDIVERIDISAEEVAEQDPSTEQLQVENEKVSVGKKSCDERGTNLIVFPCKKSLEGILEEVINLNEGGPVIENESIITERMSGCLQNVFNVIHSSEVEGNEACEPGVFQFSELKESSEIHISDKRQRMLSETEVHPGRYSEQIHSHAAKSAIQFIPALNKNIDPQLIIEKSLIQNTDLPENVDLSQNSYCSENASKDARRFVVMCSMFYSSSNFTRAMFHAFLIATFLMVTLLSSFPAWCGLYLLSVGWWYLRSEKRPATKIKSVREKYLTERRC